MSMNTIMGLFAKSPIQPLLKHASCVNECCAHLIHFFEVSAKGDWEKAAEVYSQISNLEKDADALKREIRLKLPSGLFLPVDRTDMLDLLTQQDKLANISKDIAGRVIGRQLQVPEVMLPNFTSYVQRCLDAANQAQKVIHEFDELLETGFRGREVALVEDMIDKLDTIEDDTDSMQITLRQQLLSIETEYNPVDVIFLYKTLEWIGVIADQAQRVGARLELMLSRS